MTANRTTLTRRDFLKNACLAGAAVTAATAAGGLFPLDALASPGKPPVRQQTRLLMGTVVTLTAVTDDSSRADAAFSLAFGEMERLIAVFDRHSGDTAIGRLNACGSLSAAPVELIDVLGRALALGKATNSAFNPAVTPVVELFEAARDARAPLPGFSDSALKERLALADPGAIRVDASGMIRLEKTGMRLTLDGIAKGYIADAASSVMTAQGLTNHMVNAGGDIRVSGAPGPGKVWTVGIQHPGKAAALLSAVPVAGGGIATSGSYENPYDRSRNRHHLISHLTGKSADITSVTVRASNAAQADALATALALMPTAEALRFADATPRASCLIVDRQGHCFASREWG